MSAGAAAGALKLSRSPLSAFCRVPHAKPLLLAVSAVSLVWSAAERTDVNLFANKETNPDYRIDINHTFS